MSFWPTAEEIRAGVTWVRRNPIISAGVVALAIGGAIAYLLSEESSDRAEKKQQPVDSSASSGPIAVVSSEASSIKPLKEGVERTSGATPSSSSTIIPLVPVPTPGSGSAPSSFLTSSSEDLSHSVEAVQPPPAPSVVKPAFARSPALAAVIASSVPSSVLPMCSPVVGRSYSPMITSGDPPSITDPIVLTSGVTSPADAKEDGSGWGHYEPESFSPPTPPPPPPPLLSGGDVHIRPSPQPTHIGGKVKPKRKK